jgi:ribonuclease HII
VSRNYLVVGFDEVGYGALAGPIVVGAAAFWLWSKDASSFAPSNCPIPGVKDSKKFSSESAREKVYHRIVENASAVGCGLVEAAEVNEMGVSRALREAFSRALGIVKGSPPELFFDPTTEMIDLVLVDGVRGIDGCPFPQLNRPKADELWWPVSAASIIAKVTRDRMMVERGARFPPYGWSKNKGYGTADHVAAIQKFGVVSEHRNVYVDTALATAQSRVSP